jgi:tetratricopeptide (TPR) repeat protein
MDDVPPKRVPGRPFRPGESGNRAGRPKGAPNAADILKRYLEQRVGKGDRRTTVLEEIIRQQFERAAASDGFAAQKLIFDMREKLGYGEEVTTEERERKLLRLPRSYHREEFDLQRSAARELERQQCKAILDGQELDGRQVPALIVSGDVALRDGQFDQALDFYLRQAKSAEPIVPDPDPNGIEAVSDPQRADVVGSKDPHYQAIARIGLLADQLLWAGQYVLCIKCANAAIATIAQREVPWIKLIRAHALMFAGKTDEARAFYCSFNSNKREGVTHWEVQILRDFVKFREAGRSAALMLEIEARLSEAGWTVDGVADRGRAAEAEMSEQDRHYVLLNPNTDQAASIFKRHRKFEEAFEIYRRQAEKGRFALAQQTDDTRAREVLGRAELNIGQLARDVLMAGKFDLGRQCIGEMSAESRARLSVQAVHAHLLLLTGEVTAAEEIYRRNIGKDVGGRPWTLVIWDDLKEIRAKGFATAASRRLEDFFEEHQDLASRPRPGLGVPQSRSRDAIGPAAASGISQAEQPGSATALDRLRALCARLGSKLHDLMRATGQERADLQVAVDDVADAAFLKICDGQAEEAGKDCLEALQAYPNASWPTLRQAHALAVLGKADNARAFYRRFLVGKAGPGRTWPSVLKDEFGHLRQNGIDLPLFAEIELEIVSAQNRLGIGSVQR